MSKNDIKLSYSCYFWYISILIRTSVIKSYQTQNYRKNGEQFVLTHDEADPKSDAAYRLMFTMILEHFDSLEHEDAGQTQRLNQRVIYDSIKVYLSTD